jgi:hypothetical protein
MSLPNIEPSRGAQIQIPAIVFCVISPLIVGVRFFSRIKLGTKVGIDDYVILLALAAGLACNGVLIASCHFGYGVHGADLTKANKIQALKFFVYSQYTYKTSINSTKASILLLYLRLFVQKPFRLACFAVLIFVLMFGVSTLFASIFQCTPIPRSWNKGIPGHCIDTTMFWFANAGISIAEDIIILVLPMPVIYALKLNLNIKISLMLVFALGGFVVITSILRMTTLNTTSKTPDPTWDVGATTWTILEAHIAIVCACLPMCRMPLAKIFPRIFRTLNTTPHATTGAFQHAGTSKNDWTPSQTGSKNARNQQTSVMAGPDGGSEEFILNDLEASQYREPLANKEGAGIHKTTHISVKYDDNGSETSSTGPQKTQYGNPPKGRM